MADDNDRLSFLNSPWLQLGVPLAAMVATAVAPRHTGAAARIGMAGWNGLNDTHAQQQRLSQMRAKEMEEKEEEARQQRILDDLANYGDAGDANPADVPGMHAPEGGKTPEVVEGAKAGALEAGSLVSPRWTPDARVLAKIRMLPPKIALPIMGALIKAEAESKTGYAPGDLGRLSDSIKGVPGASISSVPVQGGYNASVNPPDPQIINTHEGGRSFATRIDPSAMAVTGKVDVGQYGSEDKPTEHTVIVTEGHNKVMKFVTNAGVQKSIVVGPKDADEKQLQAGFDQKMWLLANGHKGFDPVFEAQVTFEDAKKYLADREKGFNAFLGGLRGGITPIDSTEP